jgi:UDP-N-acetylmuramoylalanine--D-glutamate ligase
MTRLAARHPDLGGLRVVVVGLGRSGRAAAAFAAARGARVVAADARSAGALGGTVSWLEAQGIEVRAGGHPETLAEGADLLVVSPGVPTTVPIVASARSRGIPVWGEMELSARFCEGRIVGITGTNGKSTTTAMTGAILRAAGLPGGTGGNLGTPLAELLAHDGPRAVHAVEISSFQLETIEVFRAPIAILLNLTPDHLDRYPDLDTYARAKARILETQTSEDAAILNQDDPEHRRFLSAIRGRLYRISTGAPVDVGAFVESGEIRLRTDFGDERVLEVASLPVPGAHNVSNALAAALAARLAGCPAESIGKALASYRALPHRLEKIAEVRGVSFFNDSKATNLDAAERALAAFPGRTVHAILGGRDKGARWTDLEPALRTRARRVLLVGEAAPAIAAALADAVPCVSCGTVASAVREGFAGAEPGDVVLLAPGCASYDQYANFEERGEDFRRAVEALCDEEGEDA